MIRVNFYDSVEDGLLRFAVIGARSGGRWVFCRHEERDTREPGESIEETAKRELYEETGALVYELHPVCVYSVVREGTGEPESFGMLYLAEIEKFEGKLHSEIEEIVLTRELPERWTYPEIQPKLLARCGEMFRAGEVFRAQEE